MSPWGLDDANTAKRDLSSVRDSGPMWAGGGDLRRGRGKGTLWGSSLSPARCAAQRMKLVCSGGSGVGYATPAALPAAMHLSSHAMLLARVRMVWRPSLS